ncbi:MAG: DNA topoisomerase I, partial [Bacteroidota bacterium]
IEKKMDKEANRFIRQFPAEKIDIENGRWGAFIRFGKKMIKIGRKADGEKYSNEELATIAVDEVKKMIEVEVPDAFTKPVKKAAAKKAPAKKTAAKKASAKKAAKK